MKNFFLLFLVLTLIIFLNKDTVFAYEGGAVANGGSISGTIKFKGTPPKAALLKMTKDKRVCGKTKKYSEELVVGKKKGIKNVVVSLENIKKGKKMDLNPKPEFTQKDCHFSPHVLLVPAGKKVIVYNKDGILHNFHSYSIENPSLNKAQPKFKKKMKVKFDLPETIKVNCDAHNWMNAWFVVADHPYYAITDEQGSFKLENVPPGTYKLKIWQESLGEQIKEVTVTAKKDTKIRVEMSK